MKSYNHLPRDCSVSDLTAGLTHFRKANNLCNAQSAKKLLTNDISLL